MQIQKIMEKSIHLHSIPASYQRNFSDNKGKIWVLEPSGEIYPANPGDMFKERHFFRVGNSLRVEKGLAEIESDFANIVYNKIEKQIPLDVDDRIVVSIFTALMLTRTQSFRNNVLDFFEKTAKWDIKRSSSEISPKDSKGATMEEIREGLKSFQSHYALSVAKNAKEHAIYIYQMKWSFLITPKKMVFICSDNPCQMVRPEAEKRFGLGTFGSRAGLCFKDVELTLPISSKIALSARGEGNEPEYISPTLRQVEQVNYRTARSASRLFANNKEILQSILEKS